MSNRKASIITLCYNQLEAATKPFIKSLYENTNKDLFELIIVNNNSSDGTKEYLDKISQEYDNIKVIHNEENGGYSKGNNQGMKIAQGEYIVLINNDALFTPNWLEDYLKILEANHSIGILAPMTNMSCVKSQLVKNFKKLTSSNYLKEYKHNIVREEKLKICSKVIFFCVAMPRTIIDRVGYLDENFGLAWYEDDDFCIRTIRSGLKIAIAQNIFIFHNHSMSSSKLAATAFGQDLARKNQNYLFEKHKREFFDKSINKIRQRIHRVEIILMIQLVLTVLTLLFITIFVFLK